MEPDDLDETLELGEDDEDAVGSPKSVAWKYAWSMNGSQTGSLASGTGNAASERLYRGARSHRQTREAMQRKEQQREVQPAVGERRVAGDRVAQKRKKNAEDGVEHRKNACDVGVAPPARSPSILHTPRSFTAIAAIYNVLTRCTHTHTTRRDVLSQLDLGQLLATISTSQLQ